MVLSDDDITQFRASIASVRSVPNPFAFNSPFTLWEAVKLLIGIVVVPLKLILLSIVALILTVVANLFLIGADPNKPITGFRALGKPVVQFGGRCVLFILGVWWIETKGKKASSKECKIIVGAPHSTAMDAFALLALNGVGSGFSKKELASNPFLGAIGRFGNVIFVDREDPDGKKKSLETFVERVKDKEVIWPLLSVFPEGTCTNRKSLIQFKKGAFVPGEPVQVVVFRWKYWFFDPTWTSSSPKRSFLIVRLMTQFFTRVQAEYLPVYVPNEEEKQDPLLFASNVRDTVAKNLGIESTEHSYDDAFLGRHLVKRGFDVAKMLDFEISAVKNIVPFGFPESKRVVSLFGKAKSAKGSAKIDFNGFCSIFNLPEGLKTSQRLYSCFTSEQTASISFREFFIGYQLLYQYCVDKVPQSEALHVAKHLFPETGSLTLKEALDKFSATENVSAKSIKSAFKTVLGDAKKKTLTVEDLEKFFETEPVYKVVAMELHSEFSGL